MSDGRVVHRSDFPDGFLWGAATAAYQIEGAVAEDGRAASIWDTFAHTPGKTLDGDTGDVAVDHYHRHAEDVAILADLGVNAYRFSVSWSRILPDGTGTVNEAGIRFYRELCTELRSAGIAPFATLYHWDLPQSLQDRGGWLNPDSVGWFARYATTTIEAIGDLLSGVATLNEPWCSAFLGHSAGEHAPGLTDPGASFVVAHHLMLAHHAAIAAMRSMEARHDLSMGIVLNLIPAWPASDSPLDRDVADSVDAINNRLFLDALVHGTYPDKVLSYHRDLGVDDRIDPGALADAVVPIDMLGVNYYNINRFEHRQGSKLGAWPGIQDVDIVGPPGELTEMGWGVEPEGLTWILRRTHAEYGPLPLMVMENGAAYPDEVDSDGSVHDVRRTRYLEAHIAAVADAIEAGVDVDGYFVWSLLDNFEWSHGYSKRFGIVRVDYDTLSRTIKDSGLWYREFLSNTRS